MRSTAAGLLALFLGSPAAAQVSEVIEVRVANVDVVVTDRNGVPITGLTRDDFQLFENGRLQPIANFYEIRADAPPAATETGVAGRVVAPAEVRRRSIAIFIDDSSIQPFRRNQVIQAIRRGFERLLRPADDAMIANWNGSLDVVQGFTSDRAALDAAIDRVGKQTARASMLEARRSMVISYADDAIRRSVSSVNTPGYSMAQAYVDSIATWRVYADETRHNQKSLLGSIRQTLTMLTAPESKKVFVFVGGQIQEHPGFDVLETIEGLFSTQSFGTNPPPPSARLTDAGRNNLSMELRELGQLASVGDVTMYFIDVADRTHDASEAGLPVPTADFMAESETIMSMGALARATGGSVLSGTRNFDVAVDNLIRDLGSYYSLGYKPSAGGGAGRRITVKVARSGAVVRSRSGYAVKTADQQTRESVITNVFHEGARSDFEVTVAVGEAVKAGRNYKVPVTVSFPSDLTFIPEGETMTGEYAVYFATAGPNGELSQVSSQQKKVRFPAESYFSIIEQPFTHKTELLVRPGPQAVSIAVVDKFGARTGYARVSIDAH